MAPRRRPPGASPDAALDAAPPRPVTRPALRTEEQVSAGGVVVRSVAGQVEAVLVLVGARRRWQLPKGLVEAGETPEEAARREVREETGVDAELAAPLETIDYWYVGDRGGERVRFRKRVHFFLFHYRAGRVEDHDREVHEARWFPLAEATACLAFPNERRVVERAAGVIAAGGEGGRG